MNQDVAILDFGSSKITVLIGSRGVNNTVCINGMCTCEYAGFENGSWFEPEALAMAVGHAISNAESSSNTKIRRLYIGVPGDFTSCACRDVNISLNKKRRVTDADIDMLFEHGNIYGEQEDYTLINVQPIYFNLDDGRRLIQPVGMTTTKLGGYISYIFAKTGFIRFIDGVMDELGIESIEYVSSLLAEALFLFDDYKRDQYVVLIDVGHITTNIVLVRGDGMLNQYNFSLGGGHITGDLALHYGISFAQAESLKRKVILSLDPSADDKYEVTLHNKTDSYPAKEVNEIVKNRISYIAQIINESLSKCEYSYPEYIPYHLTGGGLAFIKGARDYLSRELKRPVELIVPSIPQFNRPHLSSALGLLDMVLNRQVPQKTGLLGRLSEFFKK